MRESLLPAPPLRDKIPPFRIPVVGIRTDGLGDEAAKGEIVKAMFEITRAVETVKKQVMKLEKRDDSSLL